MKILNLYAGIGGNRKLWGNEHDITAVEIDLDIAAIYKEFFPHDNVIIGDAHEFLRANFRNFDFIWASPPCTTHSTLNFYNYNDIKKLKYPDMTLYQEIILLKNVFKNKWVVENVKPYYKPLIPPSFTIGRHYFWSSVLLMTPQILSNFDSICNNNKKMAELYGFDIKKLKNVEVKKVLRNCVVPEIGKYIFDEMTKEAKINDK